MSLCHCHSCDQNKAPGPQPQCWQPRHQHTGFARRSRRRADPTGRPHRRISRESEGLRTAATLHLQHHWSRKGHTRRVRIGHKSVCHRPARTTVSRRRPPDSPRSALRLRESIRGTGSLRTMPRHICGPCSYHRGSCLLLLSAAAASRGRRGLGPAPPWSPPPAVRDQVCTIPEGPRGRSAGGVSVLIFAGDCLCRYSACRSYGT